MNAGRQAAPTNPVDATTEHELKFELSASMAAEFDARAGAGLSRDPQRVWSCYYDTSAGDLMNAGIALRVRSVGDGFVQTLKAAHGAQARVPDGATPEADDAPEDPFSRFEWERPIDAPTPSEDALPAPSHPAGALVRQCLSMLLPVFETDFERDTRMVLPCGTGRVELACDRGEIRAGQAREAIAEVELERKAGSAALFYRYALQWARLHEARLLLPSKHARGLALAGWRNDKPLALRQATVAPAGTVPVARAARMVLHGHLRHFLANLPAVLHSGRPEGPHQLRVALRRLRASIRFFGLREDPLSDEDTPWRDIDRMARSIANAAGFVRDADVFESRLLGKLERSFPGDAALQVLGRSLADERERSRALLRATLSEPSTTEFILLALAAIEAIEPSRFDDPDYRSFAARRIAALVRKVRRRAGAAASESEWHDTRIAIKNLRYAMDGCRALELTREPATRVLARLGAWQDALGEGQDLAVARTTASQALGRASAPIEMAVRCIALIDGYRTFVIVHADQHRLGRQIRAQLESSFAPLRSARFAPASRPPAEGRPPVAARSPVEVKSAVAAATPDASSPGEDVKAPAAATPRARGKALATVRSSAREKAPTGKKTLAGAKASTKAKASAKAKASTKAKPSAKAKPFTKGKPSTKAKPSTNAGAFAKAISPAEARSIPAALPSSNPVDGAPAIAAEASSARPGTRARLSVSRPVVTPVAPRLRAARPARDLSLIHI